MAALSAAKSSLLLCCTDGPAEHADAAIESTSDAAAESFEEGNLDCSPAWFPIDFARGCFLPAEPAVGLCQTTQSRVKGLYAICAVSPNGTMYYKGLPTDLRYSGEGWTFGPNWLSTSTLHATPLTEADDARCSQAQDFAGGPGGIQLRRCEDIGATDAGSD